VCCSTYEYKPWRFTFSTALQLERVFENMQVCKRRSRYVITRKKLGFLSPSPRTQAMFLGHSVPRLWYLTSHFVQLLIFHSQNFLYFGCNNFQFITLQAVLAIIPWLHVKYNIRKNVVKCFFCVLFYT